MDGTIGEIRMFAGNFAPRFWAFCDGQLIAISQNQSLFSIIGTSYGGDGRTTFALPDLRGRVPIGVGNGPGLSPYILGEKGGGEENNLTTSQLPSHTHQLTTGSAGEITIPVNTASGDEDEDNPSKGVLANNGQSQYASTPTAGASYSGTPLPVTNANMSIGYTGGNLGIPNIQPFLATYYIICMDGMYPSRS